MNILGFDIGGTKCAVVLGKTDCVETGIEIADKLAFPTEVGPEKTIEKLFETAHQVLERNNLTTDDIIGIGISCGGPLDSKNGIVLSPPNLPGWDEIHIVEMTEKHFGVKAFVQNDANACAMAEWKYGAGKGYDNVIFFTFGTGMGAGLILDGKLYCGTNDCAGEVGHIRLAEDGPVGYGKAGSFEGFCSGGGIKNLAQLTARKYLAENKESILFKSEEEIEKLDAKIVADAMYQGDAFAKEVYTKCAEYLGRGLSIIIDIINPEAVVIGSIYERNKDFFLPLISDMIKKEALSFNAEVCKILPAELGDSIGDYAALGVLF